jgi:hypothetical protein
MVIQPATPFHHALYTFPQLPAQAPNVLLPRLEQIRLRDVLRSIALPAVRGPVDHARDARVRAERVVVLACVDALRDGGLPPARPMPVCVLAHVDAGRVALCHCVAVDWGVGVGVGVGVGAREARYEVMLKEVGFHSSVLGRVVGKEGRGAVLSVSVSAKWARTERGVRKAKRTERGRRKANRTERKRGDALVGILAS